MQQLIEEFGSMTVLIIFGMGVISALGYIFQQVLMF